MGLSAILGAVNRTAIIRGQLQNHWDFAEYSGSVAHDDVGLLDTSLVDGANWSTDIPSNIKFAAQERSIVLDGTGYLEIPQTDVVWDTSIPQSLSVWVNLSIGATSDSPTIVSLVSDQTPPFIVALSPSGINYGFQGEYERNFGDLVDYSGVWAHLGISYDGVNYSGDSSYALSVNGVEHSGVPAQAFTSGSALNRIGGHDYSGSYFDGNLYDLRIYSRDLGLTELGALASGYDSLWVPSTGTNWNENANWPLNGIPSGNNAALFNEASSENCTSDLIRLNLNHLTLESTYSGVFSVSASFLSVSGDFTDNVGISYPQTLRVGGNCDLTNVQNTDDVANTNIVLDGGDQTLTLPSGSAIRLNKLYLEGSGIVTFSGVQDQVKLNRLYIEGATLDANSKYLDITNDMEIYGGELSGFDTGNPHRIGGNAFWYGQSKLNLMDLNFPAETTFNVQGTTFLIRNAIVGNLNASGTAAQCLNCQEA